MSKFILNATKKRSCLKKLQHHEVYLELTPSSINIKKKELENMQGEIRRRRGESVDGRGDRILRRETTENDANSRASNGASVSAQVFGFVCNHYIINAQCHFITTKSY